jgi:hypothetical protein
MKRNTLRVLMIVIVGLAGGSLVYGQAQDHSQHQGHAAPAAAPAATTQTAVAPMSPIVDRDIFCPTMNTGQLCSHGTSSVLGVTGQKQVQWLTAARKYNQTVNAATQALMKEAEMFLDPKQMEALRSWFSDEFNAEVNKLLHSKGLAEVKK